MHALQEERFGDGRNGDVGSGMCYARGVEGGAEDGDAIVRGSEGLDAFVGLLPVV